MKEGERKQKGANSKNTPSQRAVGGIKRYYGRDLAESTAQKVQSNDIGAVIEQISNSYNADATRVDIITIPEKGLFINSDDGVGMSKDNGLQDFYRLGDSIIKSKPYSPKGRRRLGGHGTATLVLKKLAESYEMKTKRDGLETVVMEKFEGDIQVGVELKVIEHDCDPEAHGTTIKMHNKRFQNPDWINLKKLAQTIRMELPLLPDFKVYINNEEVLPRRFDSKNKFKIEGIGNHMGNVNGWIYVMDRKVPDGERGINIYVHGRRYGDPLAFTDLAKFGMAIASKTVIVLHADELHKAILLDRGRLSDDHPGYKELQELVEHNLYSIKNYVEQNKKVNTIKEMRKRGLTAARKIVSELAALDTGAISRDVNISIDGVNESSTPALYLPKDRKIVLYERNPMLNVTSSTKPQDYCNRTQLAVEEAVALHLADTSTTRGSEIGNFFLERNKILEKLAAERLERESRSKPLHPQKVYTAAEFAAHCAYSLGGARYIMNNEGVNVPEDCNVVTGSEITSLQDAAIGMVPLYDLFNSYEGFEPIANYIEKYHEIFSQNSTENTLKPFIINMSKKDSPCYFVERAFLGEIAKALKSEEFDGRKRNAEPNSVFLYMGMEFYSIEDIANLSSGMTLDEVRNIINDASQRDIEIATSKGNHYRLSDFVSASQKLRGVDYSDNPN
ncbi:hypothetical protein GF323_05440 [Candidatus Woesearchaeota archaeon]|nr:hypothetical protein [Candidatus Woesearchaeota archaeon]